MMVGLPGSGKSFFAKAFAETFHAPYIDYNDIGACAADGAKASELTLLFLREIAKTQQTFIFEGSSDTRSNRTEFAKWARAQGYTPLYIWTQTDQATCLKRSLKSGTLTREQFATVVRDFSPPHPQEKAVVISGKHTYASQAKVVLAQLSADNRPASTHAARPQPRQSNPTHSARTISIR